MIVIRVAPAFPILLRVTKKTNSKCSFVMRSEEVIGK